MSLDLHTVHVRVNDSATGQPTPVRIRFEGADGQYFAPFGRLTEFSTERGRSVGGQVLLGRKAYAYIDGGCEIRLPAGPLKVEIHKGPQFRPVRQDINLAPGKLALRFVVERWVDSRREGWFCGDTRAHFLSPHAALLEAAAEDLTVVDVLAMETTNQERDRSYLEIANILAFSGQSPALECPGHLVVVNTFNSHTYLGSLGLLNCHRIVFPLSFGGPDGLEDWTLADWCDQCHRKRGLVVWTDVTHKTEDFCYGEPLADLILGKVDAFEVIYFEDSPFDVLADWYRLLNAGCRVPLVGASAKASNGVRLGAMRTFAQLRTDEAFCYQNWIEAVRAGRTVVTNGPLLSFTVDGHEPGSNVKLASADGRAKIHAHAQSLVAFETLEVLFNGEVIGSVGVDGDPSTATIDIDWIVPHCGWLAARCKGTQQLPHRPAPQRVLAHTSPVYVEHVSKWPVPTKTIDEFILQLDAMLSWVHAKGRFANDRQRADLVAIFQKAKNVLLERRNALA